MSAVDRLVTGVRGHSMRAIGQAITLVENGTEEGEQILELLAKESEVDPTVIGVTGPPGVGKSTLTNRLIEWYRSKSRRLGVIAVDPSSPISGGAVLGDRIRMIQSTTSDEVVMRSMATRGRLGGLSAASGAVMRLMGYADCNPIIVETVGVGQSEFDVVRTSDVSILVLAPGLGDDIQAMKAGLMEMTDIIVVNKADRADAEVTTLELEQVAREKGREVLQTVATSGEGIARLGQLIDEIDTRARGSGERTKRKRRALEAEAMDWAIEMVRSSFLRRVSNYDVSASETPRDIAKRLIREFKAGV